MIKKPAKGAARKAQRSRRRAKEVDDRAESIKVVERSNGRCEFRSLYGDMLDERCVMPAQEVHHCYGGHGRRLSAESRLAENKLALCQFHHGQIHGARYELTGRCPKGLLVYRRK